MHAAHASMVGGTPDLTLAAFAPGSGRPPVSKCGTAASPALAAARRTAASRFMNHVRLSHHRS